MKDRFEERKKERKKESRAGMGATFSRIFKMINLPKIREMTLAVNVS